MAWERSFEARVMKIRAKELKYQKLNYHIEVIFNAIWYEFARRKCSCICIHGLAKGCFSNRRRSSFVLALHRRPRRGVDAVSRVHIGKWFAPCVVLIDAHRSSI